jgi:hypothetical protein
MAGLADILPKMVTTLTGLSVGGNTVVTVKDHVPEGELDASELPAILLEVMPPAASLAHSDSRRMVWPIDAVVLASYRTADVAGSITAVFGLADAVIARLDAARTFDGLLKRHIEYADPAVSDLSGDRAYGLEQMGDQVFIGARVHTLLTVDRVGGL